MRRISWTILCLVIFRLIPAAAQEGDVSGEIRELEAELEDHYGAIDRIFSELEVLKLQQIRHRIRETGLPAPLPNEELVHHDAFSLSYNEDHEQANWVVHVVTKDILTGNVSRTNDFRLDPAVSTVTADSADYWDSGYDRGHLAPSADFRWSREALSQSYFYSNMSPQVPELNRESWARLENLVREFAIDANEVIVVTGPVLHNDLPKIPQGSERVSIPELYYKVIFDHYGEERRAIAFVLPNARAPYRLAEYAVSIDSVEALTGIDFFPALEDEEESILEANNDLAVWPASAEANIGRARSMDRPEGSIAPEQARFYVGEPATVCGTVVSTKFNENGKSNPTYINLDRKFPDHVFTVVIFGKERPNFTYVPEKFLYNKKVCVSGKVEEYRGIPQIIADHEHDISILPD